MPDMTIEETLSKRTFSLDRWEHCTVVAALIHYALSVAEPSECCRVLEKMCPDAKQPWHQTIAQARRDYHALCEAAEQNGAIA